ncbi:MAG: nitroreductase/quinone reductase family protein [Actinomycetota bacterium]
MNETHTSTDRTAPGDGTSRSPWLPPRWFIRLAWRIHRGLYRLSRGRFGLRTPRDDRYGLMRVTAVGRRSGRPRGVMLAYFEDDSNLVTMAMNGWGAPEPAWWLNLQARPQCDVHVVGEHRTMRARAADERERPQLWDRWREIDRHLDAYAARRPNETAVVILEPIDEATVGPGASPPPSTTR